MASRRPPSSRGKNNNGSSMAPPPVPSGSRPRSVLAKSNSSQRSGLATPVEGPSSPPASQRFAKQPAPSANSTDDSETHIRVAIRCRRRSEREIEEKSPIIVSTDGAKGSDITIETAAPVSSLGIVTLPPTRTYPFDAVFGPEADQAMVYHEVVAPMLEEVLMGYNCTLFAYGQTGTGKTYTMQGDLTTTRMGNPSAQAGMIPRVLFHLFKQLEASASDYSVKISFVELYNEELRDLLAPDLSAPAGSTQPMGMGGSKDTQGNLKIFDDASKKGVFIQGLDEASVKNAADALTLLTKGSDRRQIAATKFNDHSSRSHSVFSITVHTKEKSSMGDDLLKVGKLNLVDLAGSENIGRSGAENKRAREAGMINQSLLTLGRVINALVERSSHVPYRESKLTRLLQDSLGGRTKTCIIATVSPARSNMEETLSTLDYAIRAKSIRNRPEVNQRMTRNSLLKEYVAEIERLKADLLAAREKNGIFFSEETWMQMTAEQELRETEMQEARKQIESFESQISTVRKDFEENITLLMKRDGELQETRAKLQETEGELEVRDTQLKVVKGALEEEVVVRQAHQATEGQLDGVASGLKKVAQDSVSDLGRLFTKLERKTTVFGSNLQAVNTHSKALTSDIQGLTTKFDAFVKTANQHLQKMRTETEQFQTREREVLSTFSDRISEQIERVRASMQMIQANDEVSKDAMEAVQAAVKSQEGLKTSFAAWTGELRQQCETTCKEAEASNVTSSSNVEKAFKALGTVAETILREAQEYIVAERKSLQEAKTMSDSATNAEILRLQEQNALLIRLLESEKHKANRARDELIKRISGLLGDFTVDRDRSLREAFTEMSQSNNTAKDGMIQLGKEQGSRLEAVISRGRDWSGDLERRGVEGKRTRDGGLKVIGSARATVTDGLTDVRNSVMSSTEVFSGNLDRHTQQFDSTCGEAFDRVHRAKKARIDATDAMTTDVQSSYRSIQRNMASTSRNVEASSSRVLSESSKLASATDTYRSAATAHLSNLRHTTQNLVEQGTREDMPTGSTPRKRSWHYVDEWQLTQTREVLLKDWRQRGLSSSKRDTFLAEHLPLPDGEAYDSPDEMVADEEIQDKMQDLEHLPTPEDPPAARSLSSSASSESTTSLSSVTSIPPPSVPVIGLKKAVNGIVSKSGLPMGTLTERSTNVLGARGSRRR